MQAEGNLDKVLDNFIWLCDLGERQNILIGLEFIGHVPKVSDVATAWYVVRKASRPYGGVVVDLFHYCRGRSRLEDLLQVPGDRISVVDIDDAVDLPREQLLGYKHRLYPGQGVIPVRQLVSTPKQKGFSGSYCVELFNETYWTSDPHVVAATTLRQTLSVMSEVTAP